MTTAREETTRLADLLRSERHALAEFLVALATFDREHRWVELGHSSLYYFLVRELGLSAGAAYYRKTAAELIQKFPEVVEPLRDGRLCFTSIVELSKNLTPENRDTLLPRFFHVSKRAAKAITAELQPVSVPPSRTVITAPQAPRTELVATLPAPTLSPAPLLVPGPPLHPDEVTPRTGPAEIAPIPVQAAKQRTQAEPLTAELTRLHVTVPRRLLQKLAAARDALSHSHPGASDDAILEVGLDLIIQRHAKRRGIGAKPRAARPEQKPASARTGEEGTAEGVPSEPPSGARSRHVPAAVARAVWERDHGCCAWPLENGGVCGSTRQVEIDHIDGWALGAGMTIEELRLLCRFHQDVSARKLYGDRLMNSYTKPKGGTCSEPVGVYAAVTATLPATATSTCPPASVYPSPTSASRAGRCPGQGAPLGPRSVGPPHDPRDPRHAPRKRRAQRGRSRPRLHAAGHGRAPRDPLPPPRRRAGDPRLLPEGVHAWLNARGEGVP